MTSAADRLRVLEVIKGLDVGGAERLLVERLGVTKALDLDIDLAVVDNKRVALLPLAKGRVNKVYLLGGHRLLSLGWLVRLRRLLVEEEYAVIHVHSPAVAVAVRIISRTLIRRPAIVTTEHSADYHPITAWANRLTVRLDHRVIAVSSAVAEGKSVRSAGAKSVVIVHGVNLNESDRLRELRSDLADQLGLAPGPRVVTVANLRPEKQLETLIRSVPSVVEVLPELNVYIAGAGPEREFLLSEIERLNLSGVIHLMGSVEDAVRLTVCADVFALSSKTEGLPVAIMEAMAAGIPIVTTDAGGAGDLVREANAGIVVPVGDVDALGHALITVLTSPETAEQFSNNAYRQRERVDIETTAASILKIYREIGSARRP